MTDPMTTEPFVIRDDIMEPLNELIAQPLHEADDPLAIDNGRKRMIWKRFTRWLSRYVTFGTNSPEERARYMRDCK